ncbi:MAG: DNA alkylation repair protein [Bacteroidota bacterium]
MKFIDKLKQTFEANANAENQQQMEAYMRNLFVFHGIKAPSRKQLIKALVPEYKTFLQENIRDVVLELYALPQREYHYSAIELLQKFLKKKYVAEDHSLITELITTHSWWDTVDFLAKHIFGTYVMQFPDLKVKLLNSYTNSENMWLNRTAILFQLGYKDQTDAAELFKQCTIHKDSDEFFIQKAIGWALREYGKVQPQAVLDFVKSIKLKELSEREAIRRLI